jgi:hypothetical protein
MSMQAFPPEPWRGLRPYELHRHRQRRAPCPELRNQRARKYEPTCSSRYGFIIPRPQLLASKPSPTLFRPLHTQVSLRPDSNSKLSPWGACSAILVIIIGISSSVFVARTLWGSAYQLVDFAWPSREGCVQVQTQLLAIPCLKRRAQTVYHR